MRTATISQEVRAAVARVDDPEFPGISIAELGMIHDVRATGTPATVEVELVPTFLGCPALDTIASDVIRAVGAVAGVGSADVRFVSRPAWDVSRISERARDRLAREFTVTVPADDRTLCPVCSGDEVEVRSPFGPTACRAIAYCRGCLNPLEIMRG